MEYSTTVLKSRVTMEVNSLYKSTEYEAETLCREAHKCILCPHTSYIPELESLGLKPNHINELNDNYEMENLVSNIKQSFFQDYKSSDVHSISL